MDFVYTHTILLGKCQQMQHVSFTINRNVVDKHQRQKNLKKETYGKEKLISYRIAR